MNKATSKDGTPIAFDLLGEGPPLVLVGGAFQHRAADPRTAELAALLAADFTVFHYDRRGRGDSGDTPPYGVGREIDDLEAVVGEAGGSAFVFGMSSGGALALESAAAGLAITKLALYEPPFIVDGSRPPLPGEYLAQLTELVSAGRRGDAVELFMTTAVGVPPEFVGQMRGAQMWPAFEEVAHTLPYDAAIMAERMSGNPLPTAWGGLVSAPTLVAVGEESPPYLHNAARAIAETLPNAELRKLEGQTHDVAPEALAPVLKEFLGS